MTELRPIPGFPGIYAGGDGECYKRLDGYFNPDDKRRYDADRQREYRARKKAEQGAAEEGGDAWDAHSA